MKKQSFEEKIRKALFKRKSYNEAFKKNRRYFMDNKKETREKYGGNIVVILDQKVIAHWEPGDKFSASKKYYKKLEKEFGEEKMKEAYITFVHRSGRVLLI